MQSYRNANPCWACRSLPILYLAIGSSSRFSIHTVDRHTNWQTQLNVLPLPRPLLARHELELARALPIFRLVSWWVCECDACWRRSRWVWRVHDSRMDEVWAGGAHQTAGRRQVVARRSSWRHSAVSASPPAPTPTVQHDTLPCNVRHTAAAGLGCSAEPGHSRDLA